MAVIRYEQFGGLVPRTHPTLLPDGCATVAHNCKLKNGKLVPLREPIAISGKKVNYEAGLNSIGDARTLYLWKLRDGSTEFVAWGTSDIDVVEGNIADDKFSRLFVTGTTGVGDGGYKADGTDPIVLLKDMDSNTVIQHSLVKEILPAPIAILVKGGDADKTNERYTYFFQTWVDEFGYESGVSDSGKLWRLTFRKITETVGDQVEIHWEQLDELGEATIVDDPTNTDEFEASEYIFTNHTEIGGVITDTECYGVESGYNDGDRVTIYTNGKIPTGAVSRNIYKVATGETTDNIQFVAQIGINDEETIAVKDEDLGELLPNIESPPSTMRGIKYVPGGFYAAYRTDKPKTVMFSDISIPTSYPEAHQYDVRDNVVALAVSVNTVFVLTDGMPYAFTGTAPEAMTCSVLQGPAACVSTKSVVVKDGVVYFASNEGVMLIKGDYYQGMVTQNLTEKIWTKDQWKALKPETCLIGAYDGALHLFFEDASYVLNLNDGTAALTSHDEKTACICVDEAEDELYFIRAGEGAE